MIKDLINFNKNFQYSINLEYDLNKNERINSFIPTKTSIKLMADLLAYGTNIANKEKDATLLVGPYGKGKSHLILVMLELLNDKNFRRNKELIKKIKKSIPEYYDSLMEYKKCKFLPIVITGGYGNFETTLLYSVKSALKQAGLKIESLHTYYEEAEKIIISWEKNSKSKDVLLKQLEVNNCKLEEFKDNLQKYNENSLKIFKKIYSEITFGIEFEPLLKDNAIKIIEDIEYYLENETDYDGLYIVFDEFSKFLESQAAWKNINEIQNLAELSARTNLGFTCITHKKISAYTHELSTEEINNWRKIEGRFKTIYFEVYDEDEYYYSLIENALKKDDVIFEKYKSIVDKSRNLYLKSPLSTAVKATENLMVKGAFPLNAYTTYGLIKLSEKVAQNERSIFTYLCKDEKYSLIDTLKKENDLVNIDKLYDYFRNLFDAEKKSKIQKIHLQTESILEQITDLDEIQVIKAIGLFSMIEDSKIMTPIEENIRRALAKDSISNIIESLVDKNLIFIKHSNNHITFLAGSGVNIKEKIERIKQTKLKGIKTQEKLNEYFPSEYIIPKKYNSKYKMIRFFKKEYLDANYLFNDSFDLKEYFKDKYSDGFLIYLLGTEELDLELIKNKLEKYKQENIVFILPKESKEFKNIIVNVEAIKLLLNDKTFLSQDLYIKTELKMLLEDQMDTLERQLMDVFDGYESVEIINQNKIFNIENDMQLNRLISDLCVDYYNATPIINYELINKRKITTQILKARNVVIKAVFENRIDPYINKTSAEYTLYRVLIGKYDLDQNLSVFEMKKNNKKIDCNLLEVLDEIEKFVFESTEEVQTLEKIYEKLENAPFGMRRSVIAVYLAYILNQHKNEIVISMQDKELELKPDLLNQIEKQPELYNIYLERDTKEKQEYLHGLVDLFRNPTLKTVDYSFNGIVEIMRRYFQNLPYYTKNSNQIIMNEEIVDMDKKMFNIRKEFLQYEINARELIFDKIPSKYYRNMEYKDILEELKTMKDSMDSHISLMKNYIEKFIMKTLIGEYNGALGSGLKYWAKKIDESSLKYITNSNFNELYYYASNLNGYGSERVLSDISFILTKRVIEDWNDATFEKFKLELLELKLCEENIDKEKEINYDEEYFISIKSKENGLKEKILEKIPLTDDLKALKTELNLVMEDYEGLVDEKDLQNLLFSMLEDLM